MSVCIHAGTPATADVGAAHAMVHLRDRAQLRDHLENRPIPLLSHAELPHARECQESAEGAVNHQPRPDKNVRADARTRTANRAITRSNVGMIKRT
jgi:hypothetical protein